MIYSKVQFFKKIRIQLYTLNTEKDIE